MVIVPVEDHMKGAIEERPPSLLFLLRQVAHLREDFHHRAFHLNKGLLGGLPLRVTERHGCEILPQVLADVFRIEGVDGPLKDAHDAKCVGAKAWCALKD